MRIQLINKKDDFHKLKEKWNELYESAKTDNPFLLWEWMWAWWQSFDDGKMALNIIMIWNESELIAIAPLVMQKSIFGNSISFMGTGISDYLDFLILRDNAVVIQNIIAYLFSQDICKIELRDIPESSVNYQHYYDSLTKHKLINVGIICDSPFLSICTNWDEYYKTLNKSVKKDLKWSLNKFNKKYELELKVVDKNVDNDLIQSILDVSSKRQQNKVGKGLFSDAAKVGFIKKILYEYSKLGRIKLFLMYADKKLIAYIVGFVCGKSYYYWNISFDPEFREYSPGKMLTKYALEDCFLNGFDKFDFMKGREPYKLFWTKKSEHNYSLAVYKNVFLFAVDNSLFYCYELLKKFKKIYWLNKLWLKASKYVK